MCLSPITILNPYYLCGDKGLNFLHDTSHAFIKVPCGKCHQCLSLRQSWFNQRIQMESLRSQIFYFTLTYNERSLHRTDIGEYKVPFPDYEDVQNMFKRMRKKVPHVFRYAIVSEYGSKKHRPHFHGFIAIENNVIRDYYHCSVSWCEKHFYDLMLKEWCRNYGTNRKPVYYPLLDLIITRYRRTYDFRSVKPIINHDNDTSFYVSKYIFKYDKRTEKLLQKIKLDPELSDKETSELIRNIKPRLCISKDFGDYRCKDIQDYIKRNMYVNNSLFPQFIDRHTGQCSLLSPYYRKHLTSVEDRLKLYKYIQENSDNFDVVGTKFDGINLSLIDDSSILDDKIERFNFLHKNRLESIKNRIFEHSIDL